MNKKIISVVSIILVIAIMCTVLAACNAENVSKKLVKKGYTVLNSEQVEKFIGADPSEDATVEWAVVAMEGEFKSIGGIVQALLGDKNFVIVTKYNKTEDAKKAVENKDSAPDGLVVKRVAKIVYMGTEAGVKAAK